MYSSPGNLIVIHEVPLHDIIVFVWCAITRIVGPILLWDCKQISICYMHSNTIFWTPVHLQENLCLFFSNTTTSAVHCLKSVFWWQNLGIVAPSFTRSESVWLVFTCGTCDSPHTEDNLKESIQSVVFSVPLAQLWHAVNMISWVTCLWVKGNHF